MDHPTRFFVVHVRKTAGTSLRNRFIHAFGSEGIYPNKTDGNSFITLLSLQNLAERWPERRDEIRVIIGHFPLSAIELVDVPFVTLTVLRDPVERTLSYLRHMKRIIPEDRDRSLVEIYEQQPRFEQDICNHMTRMYALTLDEAMADLGSLAVMENTQERLESAKARLATIDMVGFHDQFDDFCTTFADRYGIDLGESVETNQSPGSSADAEFRARIAEDNALDVELYEHALATYRVAGSGPA